MQGYYHEHHCPICDVLTSEQHCFCDYYSEDSQGNPHGYSQRCKTHTRYWIAWSVAGAIAASIMIPALLFLTGYIGHHSAMWIFPNT